MNETLFQMILTLIPVIGTIITYFIVPLLKANIDCAKLEQYKQWASLAVKTAEMLWNETGRGSDKKTYAAAFLDRMFNSKKTTITEEQINILIESAVQELNKDKKCG